jgi:hypothetical protein
MTTAHISPPRVSGFKTENYYPSACRDELPELRRPKRRLLIRNEAGFSRRRPPWGVVEEVVRALDSDRDNGFCILEDEGEEGSYVQTLQARKGFHLLEARIIGRNDSSTGYLHLRACYAGEPKALTGLQIVEGVATEDRDLIVLDDVVDSFRDFYMGGWGNTWLQWRTLNI